MIGIDSTLYLNDTLGRKLSWRQFIKETLLWPIIMICLLVFISIATPVSAASLEKSLTVVFGREGGLQCDKSDPGNWTGGKAGVGQQGCTKYGISTASYPKLDIRHLTVAEAAKIYKRDYWSPLRLGDLKSQGIATEIFDTSVNCGRGSAALIMQKTCNHLNGRGMMYPLTGKITPETIEWINFYTFERGNRVRFYKLLNGYQLGRYIQIVERNPKMDKYLNSWLSRVDW